MTTRNLNAKPRRGSLLYTTEKVLERFTGVKRLAISLFAGLALANAAFADTPDAFVEYVESDGSQYIDTGVIGRCGTSADMTVQWLSTVDASFLSSRIDGGVFGLGREAVGGQRGSSFDRFGNFQKSFAAYLLIVRGYDKIRSVF